MTKSSCAQSDTASVPPQRFDLLLRGGTVVTAEKCLVADVGIIGEKIMAVGDRLLGRAERVVDTEGKLVLPGVIDAHTHMGVPILDTMSSDDFHTGTVAAACGGVTTIIDFTVQEKGQSLAESVAARRQLADGKVCVDYALHVNVTDRPGDHVAEIPAVVESGVSSFKVFFAYRRAGMMIGDDDFVKVASTCAECGATVMVHAENDALVDFLTDQSVRSGKTAPVYHARSRPPEAEAEAVYRAAMLAKSVGARVYVVHLSSKAGLDAAMLAREQGADVILETCPQYLVLSEERYLDDDGLLFITTPPLRTDVDSRALWEALAADQIEVIATDHCPFTREQKSAGEGKFHLTPNGLPGVETLLPLAYSEGVAKSRITIQQLVALLSTNPARIFSLYPDKGTIQEGSDADLVVFDPSADSQISTGRLHSNCDWSPYEGMCLKGKVEFVVSRGEVLVENGSFVGKKGRGKFLWCRPQRGM